MSALDDATARASDLAEFRHGLHREPELGLHLPRTQQRVLDALAGTLATSGADRYIKVALEQDHTWEVRAFQTSDAPLSLSATFDR